MKELRKTPKKGTLEWMLANDDWSDLSLRQIAEVLDVTQGEIIDAISRLKIEYGIEIRYNRRPKNDQRRGKGTVKKGTNQWRVYEIRDTTQSMTVPEIAEKIGLSENQTMTAIQDLNRKGMSIDYKRRPPFGKTAKGDDES